MTILFSEGRTLKSLLVQPSTLSCSNNQDEEGNSAKSSLQFCRIIDVLDYVGYGGLDNSFIHLLPPEELLHFAFIKKVRENTFFCA